MAEETVQVCPNCGSLDVHVSRENVTDMMGLDHEYTCSNCEFTSKLFPEVPAENVEAYEEAFQEAFSDRYLNKDWGFSISGSNHSRILVGALLVFFGLIVGISPGTISPYLLSIITAVAGASIVAYEVKH